MTSVIVGAARTPIGAFLGALAPLSAPKLGAIAIRAAVERSGISAEAIDEVFMGSVVQAGVGQAPARQASLGAGLSRSIPCTTINKVCGSGLKAVMLAASQIAAGEGRVIVAGGMESMSNAPFLLRGLRTGLSLGEHAMEDANLVDGLVDAYGGGHMGLGGEAAAAKTHLSREDQDRFALGSYEKALAAQRGGAFDAEIVPVEVPGGKGRKGARDPGRTGRDPARDLARGAQCAPAGVPPGRHGDRGERVQAERRRGRGGRGLGGACRRARPAAARPHRRAGPVRARAGALPPRPRRRDRALRGAGRLGDPGRRPVRGERGILRHRGGPPRASASRRTASTSTVARSRSAIRSVPRARGSW